MTDPLWQIVEYRGRSGLQSLETEWRRLYATMPARARYHAYDAHVAYLDHLCRTPDLVRYLALTDGKTVRAICPLEPTRMRVLGIPVKVWGLPRHPHWQTTDVIAPEEEVREALIPAVLGYLRRHSSGRRVLVLGPLPARSVLWRGLKEYGPSRCCTLSDQSSCFIDCSVSHEQLMSGLSRKFRSNLRSGRRKLEQLGEVRSVRVSGRDGMEAEFAAFLDIEASGWKGQGGTGSAISLDPHLTAFYRHLTVSMVEPEDHCEICSLYAAGRCVVSIFSVRTGREYAALKMGYDESFSRLGPGQMLLEEVLERCCSDPEIGHFDMSGRSAWTRVWHPQEMQLQQAYVSVGAVSGRLPVTLLSLRFGPVRRLVRSLRRLGSLAGRPQTDDTAATVVAD